MKNAYTSWILLAAGIATVGVIIHLAAIVGGPAWYAFFGAPPKIVASARDGTWLAPISAALIAFLMAICALYACSGAGVIRRLPLLRTGLFCIAAICLIRGVVLIPFAILHPVLLNPFEIIASLIWATAGFGFALGFYAQQQAKRKAD
ncbi:hypothetical protein R6242_19135 [Iodobacter sp. CM08]|uniref:hypothetical protein n=1 Tax=Iodobacter sp. CM08 TaxID=3085902 RepID=UPI002981075B|nr:hypothetical protein [Iodobacter sp. CM08]MDW5418685.1 hypothetical protein [Iodobacter sp. CM08]